MHSMAPREPGKTRFIDHLVEGAPNDVEVQTFTWKGALRADFDVFHIHWPERLLRKGWGKTLTLLAVLWVRGIPIARTLHNIDPHEAGSRLESRLLRLIDRRTALFIRLNDHTPVPGRAPAVTVPHPHYLPRTGHRTDIDAVKGRVLYFGIVRPYKGVQTLLDAFLSAPEADATLRIVGSATGDRGDGVRAAVASDDRISARLQYVTDAELDDEILAAEIIVLPYRRMHNSGALFLALSHNRPVLVPRSAVNEDISREVGAGWVYQFDGDLDGPQLIQTLHDVQRSAPSGPPDLGARDWDVIGKQLHEAYRLVVSRG
ncbi:GDP-mannose--glycolipid 4-beta-D-mannosyltransferase [Microbacterium neimengense]